MSSSNALAGPSTHPTQRTRFAPSKLSTLVTSIKHHLHAPSHPSTTSESAHASTYNTGTDIAYPSSTSHLPLELLNPKSGTSSKYKRSPRSRNGKKPKSSAGNTTGSRYDEDEGKVYEPVSHVVVDANFEQFIPAAPKSDSGSTNRTPGMSRGKGRRGEDEDEEDGEEEEGYGPEKSEVHSIRTDQRGNWLKRSSGWEFASERVWPNVKHFFDSAYPEKAKERSFQKEAWFSQKQGAMASAAYLVISWTLTVALLPTPLTKFNWYAYFGIAGLFTLPTPLFVILDFPRRRPKIWQPWLICATWALADILLFEMWACKFFRKPNTCGTRNFLNLFAFAYGPPVLALLALGQKRGWASIGAIQWLILCGVLLIGQGGAPKLFYRNVVNFALFHAFLIGTSFLKERSERQMFALRQQLKMQYRATQSAQVMERRAGDSKKRFVSYIFHEVRVPLNTALLAVQNLEGEDVFKGLHNDQEEMVHGLMGSLTMMEKVLNDVLSFNRMESGKFTQARKPFEFHKSIQLVALSHRVQAQMAGIDLIVDLDRDIEKIGGIFVGDEMRLRQVASNLVSNSIKFTDSGSVRIVTKLLYPRLDGGGEEPMVEGKEDVVDGAVGGDLEKGSLHMEQVRMSRDKDSIMRRTNEEEERKKGKAVVRVEIHDTGVGLRKQDIIDNRLFSPYVQTEIGRRQGGKGSGLGLALVRQIVKLSHGRLGVESEFGKGSMFWFELPYSLPQAKSRSSKLPGSGTTSPSLGVGVLGITPAIPLVRIRENFVGLDREGTEEGGKVGRPGMSMSESERPLLGHHGDNTKKLFVPPESTITSTFPPVDGPTPGNEEYDPCESTIAGSDPFKGSISSGERVRRSLEEEKEKGEKEMEKEVLPKPRMMPIPPPSPEPPMCTLVVDDDRLTRMLMSRMLTRLGHQVTTAENGKIALDMIRDNWEGNGNAPRYDVVFLDNQMPLMTGVEVAREVREMGNPLYIVGCTGNALREDQDEYILAGADGIIPKPIHQKAVLDMIIQARRRVAGETMPRGMSDDEADRRGGDEDDRVQVIDYADE